MKFLFLQKGSGWPQTLCLYLVDWLSINTCTYDNASDIPNKGNFTFDQILNINSCDSEEKIKQCDLLGGKCVVFMDAYFMIAIGCAIFGGFWIWSFKNHVCSLQSLQKYYWTINLKEPKREFYDAVNF